MTSTESNSKRPRKKEPFLYLEWVYLIFGYTSAIRKNEFIFEVLFPMAAGIGCSYVYYSLDLVRLALKGLANLLPSVLSILIGFTVMLITLLITGDNQNVDNLKDSKTDKNFLGNRNLSLFQILHIQFSFSLFIEIALLLIVLFSMFYLGVWSSKPFETLLLFWECALTLNILFSILHGVTNIFFSFFK